MPRKIVCIDKVFSCNIDGRVYIGNMETMNDHNTECNAVCDGNRARKQLVAIADEIDFEIETVAYQAARNEFPAWKVLWDLLPEFKGNMSYDVGMTPTDIMVAASKIGYKFNRNMVAMALRRLASLGLTVMALPSPEHAYRKSFLKVSNGL